MLKTRAWCNSFALGSAFLLMSASTAAWAGAWQPNEEQASAEKELIDYEFSQDRAQFAWVDSLGRLWLGNVNRATGQFEPADGRGLLVDPEALSYGDFVITFNGPEWAKAADGDQIAYTKFVAGKPHSARTARVAVAKQSRSGSWTYSVLSPNAPRMAPYASESDNDPSPIITYIDSAGNHYWRATGRVNTERRIAAMEPSKFPIRPVRGARALLFSKLADAIQQVHYYDIDSEAPEQLTFDDGDKAASWMWRAPEFNNDFVLTTVANATLRMYRQLPAGGAGVPWTLVQVLQPPPGRVIYSPEPFVYNGRSYFYLAMGVEADDYPSEIWIAAVDPARPDFRRISADAPARVRSDPEVFITGKGPLIYFNRSELAGPGGGKCFAVECSEGVWVADPGLGTPP